jgi:DNA-binding transcriptional LysR family regulator
MLNQTDLSRADLNLLTLFEVVMDERHVGRAAHRLTLSPSAISHGLRRLRRLFNDPLFVRHPKGLNPTQRAMELAAPVADILARARTLIGESTPFDPATSKRRFTLGTVDSIASDILPGLMSAVHRAGSSVSVGMQQIFPQETVDALDSGRIDLAIMPPMGWPARLVVRHLYDEQFIIAVRTGHALSRQMTLDAYASAAHLLVSSQGASRGFVDDVLEAHGASRIVHLAVPSFLLGLAIVGETDLACAMPRRLVTRYGRRFGVTAIEPPVPLRSDPIDLVCPAAALADPAMMWIIERIEQCAVR